VSEPWLTGLAAGERSVYDAETMTGRFTLGYPYAYLGPDRIRLGAS
jgi:hypothetical protein